MMNDTTVSKLEQLTQAIAPGAKFLRCWPLVGGISATMHAFEIEEPGGARKKLISRQPPPWTVERNPDIGAVEFRLLQDLTRMDLPVPEPVFLDSEREFFPAPSLVVGYAEGAPEFAPKDLQLYAQRFAQQLFDIHETDYSQLKDLPDAWATTMTRIHWDVQEPDHAQRDLEARVLLKRILPGVAPGPSVLLHGDFWPGNTVWQEGEITCVIDWEEPHIGDALYDVSITRSELLYAFGEETMESFTEAYVALSGVDITNLPFWDLCAALRPMGSIPEWAAAWPALGRDDITESSMRAAHRLFVDSAMDRLSI
jgi:aminoglycoside phosphotransferase (APT) family kinase protein